MSWNAMIAGELQFRAGGLEQWRTAEGIFLEHEWPPFLAHTIDASADDEVDDPDDLTVAGRIRIEQILCATFFVDFDAARETVELRALVGNDEFWSAVNDVVRMIGAAAALGGRGRFFFRYHGGGWGHDDGAILHLADGKLKSERIESGVPPSDTDRVVIDEIAERAIHGIAEPPAKQQKESTSPARPKTKPKTKSTAKKKKPSKRR